MTYMDGKTGAEALITKALSDPALLQALAVAKPQAVPTSTESGED
jgi:type VI secretion system protein ImpB